MKCFYHPDRDAVAVCSHCRRGVCQTCAAEASGRTACSGRCENAVNALKSFDLSAWQKARFLKGFIAMMVLGALLSAFGYYDKAHAITGYAELWSQIGYAFIVLPPGLVFCYFIQVYQYRWSKLKKPTYATGSITNKVEAQR